MHPVQTYVEDLVQEIELVASTLGAKRSMARLHLGGGTPTLLTDRQITTLLDALEKYFVRTSDFEFSVEIDPTEASKDILDALARHGMNRASIGIQDFAPKVQKAIGRHQSLAQTRQVVDQLRNLGVKSLNCDLLYGLPYQTHHSLLETLDQVYALNPDRVALYGYAHVPHVSKRQVLIPSDALPNAQERFQTAQQAKQKLEDFGYHPIGIDHFALPNDSLAIASKNGALSRNFQGYTDDPCETLIGFGASAISRFSEGFVQNAVATPAYHALIGDGSLAGHKGYALTSNDAFVGDIVNQLMCYGALDAAQLAKRHHDFARDIPRIFSGLTSSFPRALERSGTMLRIRPGMEALTRIVAAQLDSELQEERLHSVAI